MILNLGSTAQTSAHNTNGVSLSMATTPLPRHKDEARTSMQSSRRRVSVDETRISSFVADICRGSHKRRPRAPREPLCPRFSDALVPRGKSERKIFDHLLVVLHERYAAVLVDLVELIPTHGSWRDLLNLLLECNHGNVDYALLRHKVWNMLASQLKADKEELAAVTCQERSPKLSLAAKHEPSQGGQHSRVLKADKDA